MDEAAAWSILPQDDHKSVWNETERNFWDDFQRKQDVEEAEAESEYRRKETDIRMYLTNAEENCRQLYHEQQRLAAQLSNVEAELAGLTHAVNKKKELLEELDISHQKKRHERTKTRDQVRGAMNQFFKGKRTDANGAPASGRPSSREQALPPPYRPGEKEEQGRLPYPHVYASANAPSTPPGTSRPTPAESSQVLARLTDVDGHTIGPVHRIEPWNQWVQVILQLPVLRDVKIRRGRKFTQENLQGIYERTEAKGVKWLACMIQAIGAVQTTRCQSCEKNQGAFEQCVIIGGDLFQKCGNCEWNRQGCHGASGETISFDSPRKRMLQGRVEEVIESKSSAEEIPSIRSMAYNRDEHPHAPWSERDRRDVDDAERTRHAHNLTAKSALEHAHAFAQAQSAASQQAKAQASGVARQALRSQPPSPAPASSQTLPSLAQLGHAPRRPPLMDFAGNKPSWSIHANGAPVLPEPTRMPTPAEPKTYQTPYPSAGSFTPANSFPPSQGYAAHNGPSPRFNHVHPGHPTGFMAANFHSRPPSPMSRSAETSPRLRDSEPTEHLEEITKENLILRDNGVVYTYPECMEGVPLVKIDESHPYWEPHWRNVTEIIQPALDSWKVKYKSASEAEARGEKGGSSKYQIGRQVNRGKSILQFLADGPLSPYQLLAKRYMTSGKGGITSYDTLFRLSDSIDQLSKFSLGIRPVDWLRHRLYEIMQEEGPEFNLSRTVHDFYRDPKLAYLRKKHGMKDIGRPSGKNKESAPPRQSLGPGPIKKETPVADSKKRKSLHPETPGGSPVIDRSPLASYVASRADDRERERLPERFSNPVEVKRAKTTPSPTIPARPMPVPAAFQSDNVSETESLCNAPLTASDFRLYQVKTRLYTSSVKVTQYWNWKPAERLLEHQCLKSDNPPEWACHKEPINFHVKLTEVAEVAWDFKSLRAQLYMKKWGSPTVSRKDGFPRGDVMVAFKRDNTMRRFLALCHEYGLKLVEEST